MEADGNCLFTASQKAMGLTAIDARDLLRRTVKRFLEDLGCVSGMEREGIEEAIKHMYSPDLKSGWGIHVVQEVKLLAKKVDREALDSAINELVNLGMQRYVSCFDLHSFFLYGSIFLQIWIFGTKKIVLNLVCLSF